MAITSQRALLVLAAVLSLAMVVGGIAGLSRVAHLRANGVTTEATALGPAATASRVYVRFLDGASARIATVDSPLWSPQHGSRVRVAFLGADPAAGVVLVDERVGGGYLVPGLAVLAGLAGAGATAAAYGRQARGRARSGVDVSEDGI